VPLTDFDPTRHGFGFPNIFVNELVTLPPEVYRLLPRVVRRALPEGKLATHGRCGGMAYAAMDYYFAGRAAPRMGANEFPPRDRSPLSRYLFSRQLQSFAVPTAARFIIWTLAADTPSWLFKGVRRATVEDELPRLRRAVDAGRPVVLGLVGARTLGAVGDGNHQVVAYGYEGSNPRRETVTVYLYDGNHPGQVVRLLLGNGREGVLQRSPSGERTWRGFFVQEYSERTPPELVVDPNDVPVAPGDLEALWHDGRVTLLWKGRSTNETGYVVERKLEPAAAFEPWCRVPAPHAPRAVRHTQPWDRAPALGGAFRVRALNENGYSEYSEEAPLEIRPVAPPAALRQIVSPVDRHWNRSPRRVRGEDAVNRDKAFSGGDCRIEAVELEALDAAGAILSRVGADVEATVGARFPRWGVRIVSDHAGTSGAEVTVRWWCDAGAVCRYRVRYTVSGSGCVL
jgi:hypothetical protein